MVESDLIERAMAHKIDEAVRSARSAGRLLIVPTNADGGTRTALAERGLARVQLGHLVLTHKGRERYFESRLAG